MAKQIKIISFFGKAYANEENNDINLVIEFVTDEDDSLVGKVIKLNNNYCGDEFYYQPKAITTQSHGHRGTACYKYLNSNIGTTSVTAGGTLRALIVQETNGSKRSNCIIDLTYTFLPAVHKYKLPYFSDY